MKKWINGHSDYAHTPGCSHGIEGSSWNWWGLLTSCTTQQYLHKRTRKTCPPWQAWTSCQSPSSSIRWWLLLNTILSAKEREPSQTSGQPHAPEIPYKEKVYRDHLRTSYPCLHGFWYCHPYFLKQLLVSDVYFLLFSIGHIQNMRIGVWKVWCGGNCQPTHHSVVDRV